MARLLEPAQFLGLVTVGLPIGSRFTIPVMNSIVTAAPNFYEELLLSKDALCRVLHTAPPFILTAHGVGGCCYSLSHVRKMKLREVK